MVHAFLLIRAEPSRVADLAELPALTPVRRLHLAAETGAQTTGQAPLGLILTPGPGGAPGVESRWSMAPAHDPKATCWRLERLRARMDPPKAWAVEHRGARFMLADWPGPATGPAG